MICLINTLQLPITAFAKQIAQQLDKEYAEHDIKLDEIETFCENNGVDMLIISCSEKPRDIQRVLNACRQLRIPYIVITPNMTINIIEPDDNILIPVSMFEEELSKAQIATSFGRFCKTRTTILQAHDYGTRAEKNVGKIVTLIEKFELPYCVKKGEKDSYGIEKEAVLSVKEAPSDNTKLIVISASRDYGLDDLIFGPKERHILQVATLPILLLNPRGDLYSLCD